ncbi:hypothetical protein CC1G_13904 [Coprinopsis cinerea okayama7|uniref:Replication protein A C-terminal domain-containing protein n=1 Tax=Coprinopsis cinerea (strain Okayama-7 / 130 / ATCC MYA-4618 / FGSC 9003) TaxID=240176 RepID=D6RKX2_COPC7|nr:hypothetical protein CC1G_13904 [Coprinopsis cinerea okayama7\|eukprot:XP_002911864.1 hypothetical protein CC1G_13904 [Coprinopsis cinerea okayama7\
MSQGFYGGSGGGGYLPGSPFSATASPGGGQKSELSASLRPMTIAQLNKATQLHPEAEWRLDDIEVGQVTIVGQILSIQQQATNSVYAIVDGTGTIEARQWLNTDTDGSIQQGLKENIYVRVAGNLKAFNSRRYINTTHIRPITDPHELYFHILESMTVTLSFERGVPAAPGSAKGKDVVMADASVYNVGSTATSDQFSHLPVLQRQIVRFLQENSTSDEGVHVSAIARAVGSGNDAQKISDALDKLMDAGHVYTTLDESHFLLTA